MNLLTHFITLYAAERFHVILEHNLLIKKDRVGFEGSVVWQVKLRADICVGSTFFV